MMEAVSFSENQSVSTTLYGATFQKTAFFMLIAKRN
jgi:hypothetical protein